MLNKYRIHELAKDFDVKSTEVIDLLSKYYTEPMKHQTLLDEEMLDIIFETFTRDNEVENFDEYFATAALPKPAREKKAEAAPEPVEPAKPQPAAPAKPGAAKAPARPAERTAVKRPGVISQPAKPSSSFQRRQKPAYGPSSTTGETKGEGTVDTFRTRRTR